LPISPASTDNPGATAWWTCPMHNFIHEAGPGKCPICGMTLVPVTAGQVASSSVTLDEAARAMAGVELAPVTVRPMRETVHASGVVTWDHDRLTDVTLK